MQYQFTITGKIIPYTRMTRRGKWVNERAQAYLASQETIRLQIRSQMAQNGWQMLPARTPLKVWLVIEADKLHTCDADNILKATMDAARGLIFSDDRWVDVAHVERHKKDHCEAWFTVGVK